MYTKTKLAVLQTNGREKVSPLTENNQNPKETRNDLAKIVSMWTFATYFPFYIAFDIFISKHFKYYPYSSALPSGSSHLEIILQNNASNAAWWSFIQEASFRRFDTNISIQRYNNALLDFNTAPQQNSSHLISVPFFHTFWANTQNPLCPVGMHLKWNA